MLRESGKDRFTAHTNDARLVLALYNLAAACLVKTTAGSHPQYLTNRCVKTDPQMAAERTSVTDMTRQVDGVAAENQ